MNAQTAPRIGILHPGAMGVSVAATLRNAGHTVRWVSEGRSPQTRARAAEHHLTDVQSVQALCAQCTLIVSVCPPSAAEAVADTVIAEGFAGIYLDANAIAPQTTVRIAEKLQAAGIRFVDGGIIGGPAWEPSRTWLYLSGEAAPEIMPIFQAGPLETEVIGPAIGSASALKMCFAARTKGFTALLCSVLAAAEQLGVRDALERDWARRDPDLVPQTRQSVGVSQGGFAARWRKSPRRSRRQACRMAFTAPRPKCTSSWLSSRTPPISPISRRSWPR